MKKIILFIAAVSLMVGNIKAQEFGTDYREKPQFGFKIGANISNVYDTKGEAFQADGKFGFVIGAFGEIPLGKYVGIHPEILFSQKGFKATGIILGSTYNFTRTSNFIDIPLLVTLKPSEFLTIMAGPQYSYLIKQTDVFANATTSIAQEQEFVNENIRKNLFCFTGGFDINIQHIVIGLRAGWDITNNNGDGTSTTPRYKNVWYQGTIGFRF